MLKFNAAGQAGTYADPSGIQEYEGSFVTDGVNDMIVSQNPVSEMLDGSKCFIRLLSLIQLIILCFFIIQSIN